MRDLDRWAGTLQLVYCDQRGSGRTPFGDPQKVSFAGTHPGSTASLVLLNPAPPLAPGLFSKFQQKMASHRTPGDDAARKAIENSPGFSAHDPETLARHQLNTFTPFFRDRATTETAALGFTETTAANVQAAPERMLDSLATLDPVRKFAGIPVPVDWAHTLVDTMLGADYVFLEGASHFAHIEDAEQLAEAVLPWLGKYAT